MKLASKAIDPALLFSALADRTRLRLLNLIEGREVCVCYFVEILGQSQPKISRHLAYLRRTGLVAARREGKWMHYRMAVGSDSAAGRLLHQSLAVLREDKAFQRDLALLNKACCRPGVLVSIDHAPMPATAPLSVQADK
ncbi:MAG: metalloregulator ArsR/SmtB family transcription factor [Acidobacteriota bacterium]|nr:metalloregulator ArsR/SmtB family transcription factor [Acidobacteriota bacterium]